MKFMTGLTASFAENEEINCDDFLRAVDHYGAAFDSQMHTPMRPTS
jgi:hypothetical protein